MTTGEHHGSERVVAELGDRLRTVGYDEAHLRARLRGRLIGRTSPAIVAVAEQAVGDDPLGAAIRFWHLGLPVTNSAMEASLDGFSTMALQSAGLVETHPDGWAPALAIAPLGERLIAYDHDDGGTLAADHVLGIGAATRTLAELTPRAPVKRALDLGTGGGAQALLARAHAGRVVATDVSPRAVWMARLSATLSGVDDLDLRTGDGTAPITGELFDLIVCNPPFVISPDEALAFRDGGDVSDGLSRRLVRDVVPHLQPGGTACLLVNWVVTVSAAEASVPQTWIEDLGCDALILHHDSLDPLAYAERWAILPSSADFEERRVALRRWTDHLRSLGATAIASGAIILRKSGKGSRVRVARMLKRPVRGGTQVERMLAAIDRFDGGQDPRLDDAVFRLAHDHRVEQRLVYGHRSYRADDAVLRLDRSAGVSATVPADLLEAIFEIDGERSLGRLVDDLADARDVSAAELRISLGPVIVELYELGFLTLAEAAG